MQEIEQIVHAFKIAKKQGKKAALATVVHVTGSSYRRPGARMLVTEDGVMTGAISGGCLEGDALRKAVLAISQEKNKLVIYDTTDEDDAKLGIQLGCNGIVSILFEPIIDTSNNHPINALENAIAKRKPTIIITSFSQDQQMHLGTFSESTIPSIIKKKLANELLEVMESGVSLYKDLLIEDQLHHCFLEYCPPAISLFVVGAGNDAIPLIKFANILGWETHLMDGRHTHANLKRFPSVTNILVGKPLELIPTMTIDARTAFILMTHNYNYDLKMLECLQGKGFGYIGLLGPMAKRERMFEELNQKAVVFTNAEKEKIFGPTGLDLGAERAEEIALSICSEVMSVMNKKSAIKLREKTGPIHKLL